MRRRAFLATAATALTLPLAGCGDRSGSMMITAMDSNSAIADRYAGSVEQLPDELRTLVERAIAASSRHATTRTHRSSRPTHSSTKARTTG